MSTWEWDRLRRNEVGDICLAPQRRFQPGLYGDHIALLSNTEKFQRAVLDAAHNLPVAVGRQLLTLIDPQHIGIVLGTLMLWVGSHLFGIGEAVDVVLGGVALVTLGWDGICALRDVAEFARGVIGARTDQELHAAARHLTRVVTVLGVDTLTVLLLRRAHLRAREAEMVWPVSERKPNNPPPEPVTESTFLRPIEEKDVVQKEEIRRTVPANAKQLQKKFKHAKDFGVSGNYNSISAKKFNEAIQKHSNSSDKNKILGTYRGQPVTFYTDPNTGLTVIQGPDGNFISGWKLNPQQLQHVIKDGKL